MPTTNRDASLVTQKNRGKAVYAYQQGWAAATVNSTQANRAVTAPAVTSAEVVGQIKLGCTACYAVSNEASKVLGNAYDANVALYPANPSTGGAPGLSGSS